MNQMEWFASYGKFQIVYAWLDTTLAGLLLELICSGDNALARKVSEGFLSEDQRKRLCGGENDVDMAADFLHRGDRVEVAKFLWKFGTYDKIALLKKLASSEVICPGEFKHPSTEGQRIKEALKSADEVRKWRNTITHAMVNLTERGMTLEDLKSGNDLYFTVEKCEEQTRKATRIRFELADIVSMIAEVRQLCKEVLNEMRVEESDSAAQIQTLNCNWCATSENRASASCAGSSFGANCRQREGVEGP